MGRCDSVYCDGNLIASRDFLKRSTPSMGMHKRNLFQAGSSSKTPSHNILHIRTQNNKLWRFANHILHGVSAEQQAEGKCCNLAEIIGLCILAESLSISVQFAIFWATDIVERASCKARPARARTTSKESPKAYQLNSQRECPQCH